jgi:membrane protease subunit (stomatin/prohibitin family)
MARNSKQTSGSNSQKSKSTGSAKSQKKSCSNCGCTKE